MAWKPHAAIYLKFETQKLYFEWKACHYECLTVIEGFDGWIAKTMSIPR